MKITVRYYGWLTWETDKHFEEINIDSGTTVRQVIDWAAEKYGPKIKQLVYLFGEDGQVAATLNRFDLNDRETFPQGLETPFAEGDVLSLIGPVSGAA